MTFKHITRLGAVTILSLGMVSGIQAQEAEAKAKVGDAEGKISADIDLPDSDRNRDAVRDRDLDRSDTSARAEIKSESSAVTKVHKASSLTGMAVMNQQNEKLGDIKDIVLDLPSGKISYVVLSVGGFLGIGDKLIAVPPSAFTVSPSRDSLVLDADKAKVEAAPGFVQTAWPNVDDPEFSSFWSISDRDAVGGTGRDTEIRQKRGSDINIDVDAGKDKALDRKDD
jgi:sporulation protein YlmC with PRC-barrel domain